MPNIAAKTDIDNNVAAKGKRTNSKTDGIPQMDTNPERASDVVESLSELFIHKDFTGLERILRISRGEFYVLKLLSEADHPLSPTYLSQQTGSSRGRISAILNSLEKRNEITRRTDPGNRRSVLVSITENGVSHIQSELVVYKTMLSDMVDNLGEEESRTFAHLLEKVCMFTNNWDLDAVLIRDKKAGKGTRAHQDTVSDTAVTM